MFLTMSFYFALDILLSLRDPFYPKDWRINRKYIPNSIIVGIITIIGVIIDDQYIFKSKAISETYLLEWIVVSTRFWELTALIVDLAIIYSLIRSYKMLNRPGMSKRMKMRYFRNHSIYSIICVIILSFFIYMDIREDVDSYIEGESDEHRCESIFDNHFTPRDYDMEKSQLGESFILLIYFLSNIYYQNKIQKKRKGKK